MSEKKKQPNPWLIALFVFLGTMLNVPIFAFGGYFRLGAIPIWIGAYFAAKGTQHLIDKRKYQKELKKNSPGNIPYSRDRLPPEVLENLELYQGYEDEEAARVEYYAGTFWINPEWKDDIIKDFSRKPVGEEEKEISKHKDKTTSKDKTKTKKSLKTVLGNIFMPIGYLLYMNHLYISAFLSFFPLFFINTPSFLIVIISGSPIYLLVSVIFKMHILREIEIFILKALVYIESVFYIWALIRICLGECDKYLSVGFLRIGFWIAFGVWTIKFLFVSVQFVCAAIKDISNAIQRKRNKDF